MYRSEGARQILLFPEGTNLTPNTIAKSNQFAEKKNLAKYNHVLHPRTAGQENMSIFDKVSKALGEQSL